MGCNVGDLVGKCVGAADGNDVGIEDGRTDRDGDSLGCDVGQSEIEG